MGIPSQEVIYLERPLYELGYDQSSYKQGKDLHNPFPIFYLKEPVNILLDGEPYHIVPGDCQGQQIGFREGPKPFRLTEAHKIYNAIVESSIKETMAIAERFEFENVDELMKAVIDNKISGLQLVEALLKKENKK